MSLSNPPQTVSPVKLVHSMIGHSTMGVTRKCLPTLVRYSRDPVQIIIHDDGSLTPDDCVQLRDILPIHSIILREQSNADATAFLRNHPKCLSFRQTTVFGMKLFDPSFYEPSNTIAYCDSDIFFMRPFTGLFTMPSPDIRAVFMKDVWDGYALSPQRVKPLGKLDMPRCSNAGLMLVAKHCVDLDRIEALLSDATLVHDFAQTPLWSEQTTYAILAGSTQSLNFDEQQIVMAQDGLEALVSEECVGIHFVSTYRNLLDSYIEKDAARRELPPVAIRHDKTVPASGVRMFAEKAQRAIARRFASRK
ncbi:MAG: hypothetical protein H7Y38_13480 [Armatimonadetes bacterium]|nr:hypothetical protein [Armatimonadota bacterium]